MFGISETDLEHILDACGYLFEQIAYFNVNDLLVLKTELEKIGFDALHSIPFCDVWKKEGASFTDKIKDVNIVPNRMESSSWRVYSILFLIYFYFYYFYYFFFIFIFNYLILFFIILILFFNFIFIFIYFYLFLFIFIYFYLFLFIFIYFYLFQLHLEMGQSNLAKIKESSAIFQFNIKDHDNNTSKDLQLEFNHAQLLQFYHKLESMQNQLDVLGV